MAITKSRARSRPGPQRTRTSMWVDKTLLAQIDKKASKLGMTRSHFTEQLYRRFLGKIEDVTEVEDVLA